MNDGIKYMIAAGAIAGVCMGAGVVIGWKLAAVKNEEFKIKSEQRTVTGGQLTVNSGQKPFQISPSVFPAGGTNLRLGPIRGTNIHLLTSVATNGGKRLVTSPPTGAMDFSAFQQVQNLPEVKQAREAAAEAQRRYFEVMKKAAEGQK